MVDNEEKRIVISVDESAKAKTIKAFAEVDNAVQKSALATLKLGDAGKLAAKKLSDAAKERSRVYKDSGRALEDEVRSLNNAVNAIETYEQRLKSVQSSGADLSGDIASSFGGFRGAAQALGGGAASPLFDVGEALADLGEFAPRLKVQLKSVGDAILASEGKASSLVTTLASTIGGITGLEASLIALAIPAALVAAAIAGVVIAFTNFTKEADKQAASLNATIDAIREVNQAVAGGLTTADAQEQLALLQRQRDAEQELLDAQKRAYDNAIASLGIIGGLAQQIAPQEQALADQIQNSTNAIQGYDAQIAALNRNLNNGSLAANDAAVAEAELAETRKREAEEAAREAEAAAQRVAQAEGQIADLRTNRAIQAANAEASASLEARFAREDDKAEQKAHYAELSRIQAEGNAKVQALQSELAQVPLEQSRELGRIQNEGNSKLREAQLEYQSKQIENFRNFAKEQGRIASDTAKAAKRLADDIADNLADAVRDNDVVAFLKIQRDGQRDLKRNAEDAKTEEQRRTEDFLNGQAQEAQAFAQKQAQILAGIEQEKQKTIQAFAERRSAIEQQIAQEKQATQASLDAAKTRFQQQEALEAQEAQRNAQRLALRQQQEDAAFQRQIAAIQQRISAESALYNAVSGFISKVTLQAQSAAKSSKVASYSSGRTGGGYTRSYSSSSAGYSGASISVSNNFTVGDVATGSQVTKAVNAAASNIYANVAGAIQKVQG